MNGIVVWITGLPRSGKSRFARAVRERVSHALILDGDEVRRALVPPPGYDEAARARFYETLARLAALIAAQGAIVLVPATAHRRSFRETARALAPRFVEVYVDTPAEVCRARDDKHLYAGDAAARLPGVGIPYEPPEHPDVIAHGGDDESALARLIALV